jgi:hypothetical protein
MDDIAELKKQLAGLLHFKNQYEPMLQEIASEKARFEAWKEEQAAMQQKAQKAQLDPGDPLSDPKEGALDAIGGPQDAPKQRAAPNPPADPPEGA